MPSLLHEILVLLFRQRPLLAPELLRDALHTAVPEFEEATLRDADLSQAVPTELRSDLVVLLHAEKPVLGIVVEVQLRPDDQKHYVWPLYLAALRAEHHCPCCLLVVTPSRFVAQWASRPIALGPAGDSVHPLVVGPDSIPVVTDATQARRAPELALLSVQAHGKTDAGFDVAMAALAASADLDGERAMLYCEWIQLAVGDAVRQKLEEEMRIQDYEFRSEFAKRYLSKGREEGRVAGRAESVLRILKVRKLDVSETQRTQILRCTDSDLLDQWIERAVTVRHTDELFH